MKHNYCEKIGSDINTRLLHREIDSIITKFGLENQSQIAITSVQGDNDFTGNTGKVDQLKHPEIDYAKINQAFDGSYIAQCINQYPDFYRWRIMYLHGRKSYSVHSDGVIPGKTNYRIHIPVITNSEAYLAFFDQHIENNKKNEVYFTHLSVGNVYMINASKLHTAFNFRTWSRIHIVGVKHE